MENQLAKVMSERSDDQLIRILTSDRQKYTSAAIEAAEKEVENRKLDPAYFEEKEEEYLFIKETSERTGAEGASTTSRLVNYLIDIIAGYIFAVLVIFIITMIIPVDFVTGPLVMIILLMASFLAYYISMEVIFQKTLGKFITKTKVVTINGEKPKEQEIVLRTLCRMIPFDHFSFLFSRNGWHDQFSKTRVIKDN